MLKLITLCCIVATVAQELPNSSEQPVHIITERSFLRQDGYDFEFQTSDGTSRKEQASLFTVGNHQGIGVMGSYSYTGTDGRQYMVTFTADDKGYRPQIYVVPPGNQPLIY